MIKHIFKRFLNISFAMCQKTMGALVRPNGITVFSKCPYRMQKADFHSSPGRIRTRLYAPRRSFVKNLAPFTRSKRLDIRGSAYLFLMVTLLKPRCRENPSLCADRETEPPGFWTRRIKCSNVQHKHDINLRQVGETNHSFISK